MLGAVGLTACGLSSSASSAASGPTAAGTSVAASGAPATAAPSPGATLSTAADSGETAVISNQEGDGFTVLYDPSDLLDTSTDDYSLQAYDAAGNRLPSLPAGQYSGGCGAADVVNSAGRLVITLHIVSTPAEGINAASDKLTMTAWNAATGASVWTDTLVQSTTDPVPCPLSEHELAGDLWNFSATLDGHWGVFVLPNGDLTSTAVAADAIDLTNGKLYPNQALEGVLGNDVVTGSGSGDDDGPVTLTVTTPGSWAPLGTVPGSGAADSGSTGLLLPGQATTENGPVNYGPTGYTGDIAAFQSNDAAGPGDGVGAVVTPDGDFLIASYTKSDGSSWYGGYSLPSLHQVWSTEGPAAGDEDQIAGISDTALLIARSEGDTYLLSLDPATGQQQWKADIGAGGALCDLTGTQLLALANNQLATLSTASGKQLSYQPDSYTNESGSDTCPAVVESGLGGTGFNNDEVTQLLKP